MRKYHLVFFLILTIRLQSLYQIKIYYLCNGQVNLISRKCFNKKKVSLAKLNPNCFSPCFKKWAQSIEILKNWVIRKSIALNQELVKIKHLLHCHAILQKTIKLPRTFLHVRMFWFFKLFYIPKKKCKRSKNWF